MSARRRALVITLGLLSLGLGVAGVAWACSPDASLGVDSGSTAPGGAPLVTPGDDVEVTGEQYLNGQPVRITWNAADGALLGTENGSNFTTTVTIPSTARPGEYYEIYGLTQTDGGGTFGESKTVYVGEPAGEPAKTQDQSSGGPSDDSGNGGSNETRTSGGDREGSDVKDNVTAKGGDFSPTDGRNGNGSSRSGRNANANSNGNRNPGSAPGAGNRGSVGTASPTVTSLGSVGPDVTASTLPAAVDDGSGNRVFGGSVGPDVPRQLASAPNGTDSANTSPSDASASSDLWSGFAEDGSPSLLPGLGAPPSGDTAGVRLALGITLMGAGLVALLGGLLVADRRRRALAHAEGSRRND